MLTVLEVLRKTEAYFAKAGLESPKIEAEWLLAGVLGCQRLELFLQWDRPLEADLLDRFRESVRRRSAREPLQYILGYTDFHEIRLAVGPGVLVPRPETEGLVERVVQRLQSLEQPRIVDLGTGSGAIALALARALPGSRVLAVDQSAEALLQARDNADRLGLRDRVAFRSGDWLAGLTFQADAIVANPPYLSEAEWASAQPEVRGFEPREALVAAQDGLADLLRILREAPDRLAPGGFLALETGIEHGPALCQEARSLGYSELSVEPDTSGRNRYFLASRPLQGTSGLSG